MSAAKVVALIYRIINNAVDLRRIGKKDFASSLSDLIENILIRELIRKEISGLIFDKVLNFVKDDGSAIWQTLQTYSRTNKIVEYFIASGLNIKIPKLKNGFRYLF
jgi:hypothetical protein